MGNTELGTRGFSTCWYFFLRTIFRRKKYPEEVIDEIRFIPDTILERNDKFREFLPLMEEELLEGPYLSDNEADNAEIYERVTEQLQEVFAYFYDEAALIVAWIKTLYRKKNGNVRVFWDMDGTLAKWRPEASFSDLFKEGYFATLVPEESLCRVANEIAKLDEIESYILTSVLEDSFYAKREKTNWIRMHVPALQGHILCVPCGVKKSSFVEDLFHRELSGLDILIDDHSPNLITWKEAGGTALKWVNDVNNTGKSSFTGARINSAEQIDSIVKNVQEYTKEDKK